MNNELLPSPPLELLELATGYQRAKTLFALIELEVPTLLATRALDLDSIARAIGLHPRAADRLLNAGVALQILQRDDAADIYRNTAVAETFLVKSRPAYLGEQFLNYDRTSYLKWAQLTRSLREWQPGETDSEAPQEADQGSQSMAAQHNLALLVGHRLAKAYDFSQHRVMLDLGGGTAAMSIAICREHKHLSATVFDLPAVAEVAQRFVEEDNLTGRIEVETGDFKEDDLPTGFDVVLLANFLSLASEETNRVLFRNLYNLLPDDGAIVMSGWILDDTRTSPLIPVLFCLEDINWQVPDVERTEATYREWLRVAGFVEMERHMYCPPTSMIVGRKRATK